MASSWSELPGELLLSIFQRLPLTNIIHIKAVCSYWRAISKAHYESSSYSPPCLLLPPQVKEGTVFRFFIFEGKVFYKSYNMPKQFCEGLCLGSSHGWLVFLDKSLDFYLFHPFSRARAPLPSLYTFPDIVSVERFGSQTLYKSEIDVEYRGYDPYDPVNTWNIKSVQQLRGNFIAKVVLSSQPSCAKNNLAVLVMYSFDQVRMDLAFCMLGDDKWTKLNTNYRDYYDILCHSDRFFALYSGQNLEVWEFHDSFPIKTLEIETLYLPKILATESRLHCSKRYYLVEVSGDFLLIVRYFVDYNGQAGLERNGCKTLKFHVFRLDFDQKSWVKTKSLEDRVLFLGGNHSMSILAQSVPNCEANSIYFTDDNWKRMNGMEQQNIYRRYDCGVFNLNDKTVKPLCGCDSQRIEPPPFWVIPNPW